MRFKSIVHVLRDHGLKETLIKQFRTQSADGLADALDQLYVPSFAKGRWYTMEACCNSLGSVLSSLTEMFNVAICGGVKDETSRSYITNMALALFDAQWLKDFSFVDWGASWLGKILRWGKTCPCHHAEFLASGVVRVCWRMGRLLKTCVAYCEERLQSGLSEAESWLVSAWGDMERLRMCRGAVRSAYMYGHELIGVFTAVPYLFARLQEPGVKQNILRQWHACSPDLHVSTTARSWKMVAPCAWNLMQ